MIQSPGTAPAELFLVLVFKLKRGTIFEIDAVADPEHLAELDISELSH